MDTLNSSDLIDRLSLSERLQHPLQLVHFRDGKVLALSAHTLAFYKNADAIQDDLGMGLLAVADIPERHALPLSNDGWVEHYKAGFISLRGGLAILITPLAIQLFPNPNDALHNRNLICQLDIEA